MCVAPNFQHTRSRSRDVRTHIQAQSCVKSLFTINSSLALTIRAVSSVSLFVVKLVLQPSGAIAPVLDVFAQICKCKNRWLCTSSLWRGYFSSAPLLKHIVRSHLLLTDMDARLHLYRCHLFLSPTLCRCPPVSFHPSLLPSLFVPRMTIK